MINLKCAPEESDIWEQIFHFLFHHCCRVLLENTAQPLSWLQRRMRRGQNLYLALQWYEAHGTQVESWKNNGSWSRSSLVMGEPQNNGGWSRNLLVMGEPQNDGSWSRSTLVMGQLQRGLKAALLPHRKSATALQMLKPMKNPLSETTLGDVWWTARATSA